MHQQENIPLEFVFPNGTRLMVRNQVDLSVMQAIVHLYGVFEMNNKVFHWEANVSPWFGICTMFKRVLTVFVILWVMVKVFFHRFLYGRTLTSKIITPTLDFIILLS